MNVWILGGPLTKIVDTDLLVYLLLHLDSPRYLSRRSWNVDFDYQVPTYHCGSLPTSFYVTQLTTMFSHSKHFLYVQYNQNIFETLLKPMKTSSLLLLLPLPFNPQKVDHIFNCKRYFCKLPNAIMPRKMIISEKSC